MNFPQQYITILSFKYEIRRRIIMSPQEICIIGFGPSGLCIFERIVAYAKAELLPPGQYQVHIVDPNEHGTGVHSVSQPDYLTLNTICGQLTMYADASTS